MLVKMYVCQMLFTAICFTSPYLHIDLWDGPRSDIKSYTDMTAKSNLTSTYLLCSELKRHNQAEIIRESVFIFILVS